MEYLRVEELHGITGFARPGAQARWLKEHGIPHQVDGRRVIVSRLHVRAWLEGDRQHHPGLNLRAIK